MQGIGCFDGFYEDWIIENNIIITDHWHGITLVGARNCRIVNNTVIDRNSTKPGPLRIRIGNRKNGQPSTGNIIRNNLATGYSLEPEIGIADHNLTVPNRQDQILVCRCRGVRLSPSPKMPRDRRGIV